MDIKSEFLEFLADVCVKIFQIIFAILVAGMIARKDFNLYMFIAGTIISCVILTLAIALQYNATIKED